ELDAAERRSSGLEFDRATGHQRRSPVFRSLLHRTPAAKLVQQNSSRSHALSVVLSLQPGIAARPAHLSVSRRTVVFLANPDAHLGNRLFRLCRGLRLLRSTDAKNQRLANNDCHTPPSASSAR